MRIRIIAADEGRRIGLWFPTRFLASRLFAWILARGLAGKKKKDRSGEEPEKRPAPPLTAAQIHALLSALYHNRKALNGEPLVDIVSSGGDVVKITL